MELPQRYNHKEAEAKWQAFWEKEKIYSFDPKSKAEIYSIDTPPPTVSGKMHLGHAFSYAQQDFVIRFQRMLGKNIFYPFGTDDNGIPTQRLIEKTKNVKAHNMPREEFVKPDLISSSKPMLNGIYDGSDPHNILYYVDGNSDQFKNWEWSVRRFFGLN